MIDNKENALVRTSSISDNYSNMRLLSRSGRCFFLSAVIYCLVQAPSTIADTPFREVHGVKADKFQDWINKAAKGGFQPISVSAFGSDTDPRFASVAVKRSKASPWKLEYGVVDKDLSKLIAEQRKKGFRVVSISGYHLHNGTHYAVLWTNDGSKVDWEVVYGLSAAGYQKVFDDHARKGFHPIHVMGYAFKNDVHYAAVFVADKASSIAFHNLTTDEFGKKLGELPGKGFRLTNMSPYPVGDHTHVAAIFTKTETPIAYGYTDLTADRCRRNVEHWGAEGFFPIQVSGYAVPGDTRYAAIFAGAGDVRTVLGEWAKPIDTNRVVAVHLTLLPNRSLLMWPRTQDADGRPPYKPDDWHGQLYDLTAKPPAFIQFAHNARPLNNHRPLFNIFCSGHCLLADGRLLVAGGHIKDGVGENKAVLYDTWKNTWTPLENMKCGRWYPSLVTLANGDALVVGGDINGEVENAMPQVFQIEKGRWRNLPVAGRDAPHPNYAFLHVAPKAPDAPNGRVFLAGPTTSTGYIDTNGNGKWTEVGRHVHRQLVDYASSVMYQPGKVLMLGGGQPPTNIAEVIDLTAKSPQWQQVAPMSSRRRHQNATILPDGSVFVSGGTSSGTNPDNGITEFNVAPTGVFLTELWNPNTMNWVDMAEQAERRLYHSTAILMPDGRVMSAGGGEPAGKGSLNRGSKPLIYDQDHHTAQYYSPPYLFRGARPIVAAAPDVIKTAQTFEVKTPDADNVRTASLVRLGSATHAFNFNQRFNLLTIHSRSAGSVKIDAPTDLSIAPPGHYMLFVLNQKGVPSLGRIIRIY